MHLRNQTPESLVEAFPELSATVSRRIVSRLVSEDRDDLDAIEGLGTRRRAELLERSRFDRLEIVDRQSSAVDPFVKYLFRAPDGVLFEAVRVPLEKPRWSACVSTQAGCGLACAFCETGRLGFRRNLEPWEIVEQVLAIRREGPERPVWGVLFQGQGEPFQNYDNVIRAAEILRNPSGGKIRGDRITVTTSGILPMIERYTAEGHPYRLILSLTSAFDEKRSALIPVGKKYGVADLAAAMRRHAEDRREVINLAWVLMAGVNDGEDEAAELGRLFAGVRVRLSVIDVTDPTGRFRPPDEPARARFFDALRANGIPFARRYSGGADIGAACGTLASRSVSGLYFYTFAEGESIKV
jgi:23S rRNA (adenine2503-C2)-methyltransferase